MEIMRIILEILILIEVGVLTFILYKSRKRQSKKKRLEETEIMVEKIRLNNKWENIDFVIEVLSEQDIHIDFGLRE